MNDREFKTINLEMATPIDLDILLDYCSKKLSELEYNGDFYNSLCSCHYQNIRYQVLGLINKDKKCQK